MQISAVSMNFLMFWLSFLTVFAHRQSPTDYPSAVFGREIGVRSAMEFAGEVLPFVD